MSRVHEASTTGSARRSTDASRFRRFGLDFTGTRPTIRLGDPGFDASWLRRYRAGSWLAVLWWGFMPMVLGIGLMSAWGPFGAIDAWQLDTFGSGNVILLVILAMPLLALPILAAKLLPVDDSRAFLIGVRQAFDNRWGPKLVNPKADPKRGAQRALVACRIVAGSGAALLCASVAWGVHDADSPHAPLVPMTRGALLAADGHLPHAARVTGLSADRVREWRYDYVVRRDSHLDVYYPLRGPGSSGPADVIEVDRTFPQDAPAVYNMVDPPGPREGTLSAVDDWTADRLRAAGIAVAPHAVLLERRHLEGRDPDPDPMDAFMPGIVGFTMAFMGVVGWVSASRRRRTFVD